MARDLEKKLAERPDLKPYRGRELTVTAWLWARTVIFVLQNAIHEL